MEMRRDIGSDKRTFRMYGSNQLECTATEINIEKVTDSTSDGSLLYSW